MITAIGHWYIQNVILNETVAGWILVLGTIVFLIRLTIIIFEEVK